MKSVKFHFRYTKFKVSFHLKNNDLKDNINIPLKEFDSIASVLTSCRKVQINEKNKPDGNVRVFLFFTNTGQQFNS